MKPYILLVILITFLLCSCTHKDKTANTLTTTATTTYTFSYTGNLVVGDSIHFVSTAPASSTFLWKFGDGRTSTLATPTHVYTIIPCILYLYSAIDSMFSPDTVILIVNNDTLHPTVQYCSVTPGVYRFTGTHTWRHFTYSGPNGNYDTTQLTDTSFAISMIDSFTVEIGTIVYKYSSYWANYIVPNNYYAMVYNDGSAPPDQIIGFNYFNDSMYIFKNNDPGALGGISWEYWSYP